MRPSRVSVVYSQKMYYGLRAALVGGDSTGKKSLMKSLKASSDNKITFADKVMNVDYIFDVMINPSPETDFSQIIACIFLYDVTSKQSFETISQLYESFYSEKLDQQIQFSLLIGNKSDLEEYREVESTEGEEFAQQNQMGFLETSAEYMGNIDYIEKLMRMKSNQILKKYKVEPQSTLPSNIFSFLSDIVQIEEMPSKESDESDQSDENSEKQSSVSDQHSVESDSLIQQPPSLPDRSQSQIDYIDKGQQTDLSQDQFSYRIDNSESRPLPSVPNSATPNRQSSPQKQTTLISDLLANPVKTNLNAKFNSAARKSPEKSQKFSSPEKLRDSEKLNDNSISLTSNEKQRINESIQKHDSDIQDIENELSSINEALKSQKQKLSEKEDLYHKFRHYNFIKQDDTYIPIIERFEPQQTKEVTSQRSKSPISNRANQNKGKNPNNLGGFSKQFKPVMFLSVDYNNNVLVKFVEVYAEDTLQTVADKIFVKFGLRQNEKARRMIKLKVKEQVEVFNEQLQSQIDLIYKKILDSKLEEGLNAYFFNTNSSNKQMEGQNSWENEKEAIGKIKVELEGKESVVNLFVHPSDDPYELAFQFLLDNDLQKRKVVQLSEQIKEIQMINGVKGEASNKKKSGKPKQDQFQYLFQGNFDIGHGIVLPLRIGQNDDVNKKIYNFVQENNLKFEQYQKILEIVTLELQESW